MREDKTDQELIAAHRDYFRTVHPDIRRMALEEYASKGKSTGVKTIIHVNQHAVRRNIKAQEPEPVLTVKTYKSNTYAHEVEIMGSSRVVYSPHKPLSCGARVWIETESEVRIIK